MSDLGLVPTRCAPGGGDYCDRLKEGEHEMSSQLSLLRNMLVGIALATAVAATVTTTVVYAASCCTQCTCVNLCVSDDGCGSNSGVVCGDAGTYRLCNGSERYDYCSDHCPPG